MAIAGAAFAAIFLVLIVWVAVVLTANPVGELGSELVYLTWNELRLPAFLAFGVVGLETLELVYPLLVAWGAATPTVELHAVMNLVQGAVLVIAGALVLRVVMRYTHSGLERRIRSSIETLAFLQGQRRKRRKT